MQVISTSLPRCTLVVSLLLTFGFSSVAQNRIPAISGKIFDSRGKPVRNAEVCFYRANYFEKDASAKKTFPHGASRCRKTDRNGTYLLFLPDYSPYVMLAKKKGRWISRTVIPSESVDTLTIADTLKATGSLSFYVATEKGKDNASQLALCGTPFLFNSSIGGSFKADNLPEGSYAAVITAKSTGYRTVQCSLRVRSNQTDVFSDTLFIPKERAAFAPVKQVTLTKEPKKPVGPTKPTIIPRQITPMPKPDTTSETSAIATPVKPEPKKVNLPPKVTVPGDTFIGIFDPLTLTGTAEDDQEVVAMEWDIGATGSFIRCDNGSVQLPPHKAPIDRLVCIFRAIDNLGAAITDTTVVRVGLLWARISPPEQLLGTNGYSFLQFKEALWIIGGNRSEVWTSKNGISWTQLTSTAAFGKLFGHQTVVFKDRLWIIGGKTSPKSYSKAIWSSPNGLRWRREATMPFTPRHYHGAAVFGGKMWVVGGLSNSENTPILNDIWCSEDGINWKKVTEHAPFSPRYGFGCTVFQNKLTIAGGFNDAIDQQQNFGDVWQSPNGADWKKTADDAPFSKDHYHSFLTFDDKLWAIGGYIRKDNQDLFTDILYTANGTNWINLTPHLSGGGRFFCTAAPLGSRIIVSPSESRKLWLMQ